jgi:hypothetical protein
MTGVTDFQEWEISQEGVKSQMLTWQSDTFYSEPPGNAGVGAFQKYGKRRDYHQIPFCPEGRMALT